MKTISFPKAALMFLIFSSLMLMGSSCGPSDLSLINQVKRFEPEWMNLSEKVSFINQYLRLTERRYPKDLEEVDPFIKDPGISERNNLMGLRSQYRNLMTERDEIQAEFDERQATFIETVERFNEWQTKLMKSKLNESEAPQSFQQFQQDYASLKQAMSESESKLLDNIELHNSILRQITSALKLYTNYDIIVSYQ
jgi:chromosome segregation ATPase